MQLVNKINTISKAVLAALTLVFFTTNTFAEDLFATAMQGAIQDSLGSTGTFWKVFILVDIILATALAVKTKNPMVFLGVTVIAFVPALLIKTFVF